MTHFAIHSVSNIEILSEDILVHCHSSLISVNLFHDHLFWKTIFMNIVFLSDLDEKLTVSKMPERYWSTDCTVQWLLSLIALLCRVWTQPAVECRRTQRNVPTNKQGSENLCRVIIFVLTCDSFTSGGHGFIICYVGLSVFNLFVWKRQFSNPGGRIKVQATRVF